MLTKRKHLNFLLSKENSKKDNKNGIGKQSFNSRCLKDHKKLSNVTFCFIFSSRDALKVEDIQTPWRSFSHVNPPLTDISSEFLGRLSVKKVPTLDPVIIYDSPAEPSLIFRLSNNTKSKRIKRPSR